MLGILFRRLALLVTLGMNEFGVFNGISVSSISAVEFGIFQRHFAATFCAPAILKPPFHGFELSTHAGLASFVITKLLHHHAAISEEQERISIRQRN